ncbi:RUN and FYVE domain-containing protein 4 [Varanus komodoensis]|nr:RUN and FYVE domain-containing protein 4 [Varanus komodoensis]
MSGKEPLLGTLKVCILDLQGSSSPYKDASPHIQPFCEILEMILRKGIKQPVLGFKRKDYWHWVEQLSQQETHHSLLLSTIEKVNSCEKVLTAQGRGRYFLRLALNGKLLAVTVQQLIRAPRVFEWYDPVTSILGNEEFSEPFLSMMLVVTEMRFSLDLQNSSFLDESWQLPVCLTYETVPCRELGMVLRYLDGRIFIIDVLPQSQAEVDEVVLVGDVIDEINGFSLRNAYNGQAGTVLQKLKGKPLSFRLIRWKWHDGGMYKPLLPYLKVLREKIPSFQLQHDHVQKEEKEVRSLQGGRLLYNLRYLGQVNVGKYGGKEVLDLGIPMVIEKHLPPQDVLFDVKETEVLVQQKGASKVLFRYPYTDISCVGRRLDSSHLFAFCCLASAESPEHSTFDCLVFESSSEESEEIIKRIASGMEVYESRVLWTFGNDEFHAVLQYQAYRKMKGI